MFKPGDRVGFIDEPSRGGIVSAISDCGTCVYYAPWVSYGYGFRVGVRIDLLMKVK